jgi:hypothetical protein
LGRSPSGRAIRYNGLFVTSQTISAAIPNAKCHVQAQFGLPYKLNNPDFTLKRFPFAVSLGLRIAISKKFWNQFEKKIRDMNSKLGSLIID